MMRENPSGEVIRFVGERQKSAILKEEIIQEKAEVPYQETVIRCPGFPGKLFTGY